MHDVENFSIFTETTESMGLLYNSYKSIPDKISDFMSILEKNIELLIDDPTKVNIDLKNEINKFKEDITKKFNPGPININKIPSSVKNIEKLKISMDKILERFSKAKNKVAFGGNYIRAILIKPKVYLKDINNENYSIINKNIRNVNRGLDWIEKAMIDMYNMIDQDLNILTIVDKVYRKNHIYEGVNMIDNDDLFLEEVEEDSPVDEQPPSLDDKDIEDKKESMPKKTDKAEANKNGVRRKKLYIAFIEWCKEYNQKNVFGSIFDKDAFKITYPFVPDEMRYFYRLANPILCVLGGELTFFQASELRKVNAKNPKINELLIFAATPNDMRVFNTKDKKIYRGTDENGQLKLNEILGDTFDIYIQNMINKGDILNGPIEESVEYK